MFETVRAAAVDAIQAQHTLLLAMREYSNNPNDTRLSHSDVSLLLQLISSKIYPVAAFGILAKHDHTIAIDGILSRYLGREVDVDRGFGGFVFDVSSMLSDLVDRGGEKELRELLQHPQFNQRLLNESRFIECLEFALDRETSEVHQWLNESAE